MQIAASFCSPKVSAWVKRHWHLPATFPNLRARSVPCRSLPDVAVTVAGSRESCCLRELRTMKDHTPAGHRSVSSGKIAFPGLIGVSLPKLVLD